MSSGSSSAGAEPAGTAGNSASLSADIRRAIELGRDIQETVRNVTLKALTKGELDTASLKRVAGDVLKGAMEGASHRGAEAAESMRRAVAGLDEAFAKAAEAATLAAREASGRMQEFTSGDLRRAMDDRRIIGIKDSSGNVLGTCTATASGFIFWARPCASVSFAISSAASSVMVSVGKVSAMSKDSGREGQAGRARRRRQA